MKFKIVVVKFGQTWPLMAGFFTALRDWGGLGLLQALAYIGAGATASALLRHYTEAAILPWHKPDWSETRSAVVLMSCLAGVTAAGLVHAVPMFQNWSDLAVILLGNLAVCSLVADLDYHLISRE